MLSGTSAVMTFARVAQWLEHYTDNVGVHGSNPCARTIIAQKLAALAVSKAEVRWFVVHKMVAERFSDLSHPRPPDFYTLLSRLSQLISKAPSCLTIYDIM